MKRCSAGDEKADRTTKLFYGLKDHPIIAIVIVLGVVIIAIANFTDAVSKIWEILVSRKDKPEIVAKINAVVFKRAVGNSKWQGAYSGSNLPPIPVKVATDSGRNLPPIPVETCHLVPIL